MERIQPIIDWFEVEGGKYCGDSASAYNPWEETWETIENTGNHEIQYRGLQIFAREETDEVDESTVCLQYLLDVDRFDEDGTITEITNQAIDKLKPLLPQHATFNYEGTEIWLDRFLDDQDLEPTNLNEILTPLTSFAELAKTKLSIFNLAPEFKLRP